MVSTCANPQCSAPFHHIHEGRLFVIDPRDRKGVAPQRQSVGLQFYWLCQTCAERFTVAIDATDRVACILRSSEEASPAERASL